MKKIRMLVMALALTACSTAKVYAALPYNNEGGLVVMGGKAYSVYYLSSLNSATDIRSINDRIAQYAGSMYYCYANNDSTEAIINTNNITNGYKYGSESVLNGGNQIICKGINGEQTYVYNSSKGEYEPYSLTANAYVKVENVSSSIKMMDVVIYGTDIKGIKGAPPAYFKLEHSATTAPLGSHITCMINKDAPEKVYILSADKKVIATGVIDTTVTYGNTYSRPFVITAASDNLPGNSVGNINNNGYAAYDGTWIYYNNTADKGKLYKIKPDGAENQPISDDQALYINVVGNVVYYSNYTDGGKIYKVNTDGTGRTKVSDDMASYLNISGNYIYYSNHSKGGSLCKIDVSQQGGAGQQLTSDSVAYLDVEGDTIYYSNVSDNNRIYSINTDGLCKVRISDDGAKFLSVAGDYIYYNNYSDSGRLYKIKRDGSNTNVMLDKANAANMVGDYIYYSNILDGGKLYKVKYDGSGRVGPLTTDAVEFVNVVGSNVYYTKAGKLYVGTPSKDAKGNDIIVGTAIAKPSLGDKIATVNNVTDVVASEAARVAYPFPDRVSAVMNNNVMKELVVNWDKTKYTKKGNSYTYNGTVLGYGDKVTITLTVTSSNAVNPNNVIVTNNAGNSDNIQVTGLKAGDTIKIYNDVNAITPMSTTTVKTGDTAISANVTLSSTGGSIWVTVTSAPTAAGIQPTESDRVEVKYQPETQIPNGSLSLTVTNNSGATDTVKITGALLQVGDVVKVYGDVNSTTAIASAKVTSPGIILLENVPLNPNGGKVYVTITSQGKTESGKYPNTGFDYDQSQNMKDVVLAAGKIEDLFNNAKKGSIDGSGNIIKDMVLPIDAGNGVAITWTSSNQYISVVGYNAIVHRPIIGTNVAAAQVDLSATFIKDDAKYVVSSLAGTDVQNQILRVKVAPMTAAELVEDDKNKILIGYGLGDDGLNVTKDITLPINGQSGSTITWSSNDAAVVIGTTPDGKQTGGAKVVRPVHGAGDKSVTLTATVTMKDPITSNQVSTTRNFSINIKEQTGAGEDLNTALTLIPDTIEVYDGEDATIKANIGSLASGINVQWQSSDSALLYVEKDFTGKQTGKVTANSQSYTIGDKIVTLTAALSKGGATATKTISVTVHNKKATDQEFVDAVADKLSLYRILLGGDVNNLPGKIYLPTLSYASSSNINGISINGFELMVSPISRALLPIDATDAATITWTSSDNSAVSIENGASSGLGTIYTNGTNKQITLTATITRGGSTAKRVFVLNVK